MTGFTNVELSNFLRGMGSILELFPIETEDENIKIPTESDEEAIRKDWETVGRDIYSVISKPKENDE